MLTIAKLFGKSPFALLQTHMDKVSFCVGELPLLFKALQNQDLETIQKISTQISRLEHDADLTKNDIRSHLPKSLFLPVDRGALLKILALQDAIADQTEEIAHHASIRKCPMLPEMEPDFSTFCSKNMESFGLARKVIKELEELLEASFGGIEAQKVKGMVEQIAFCEYEKTQLQKRLIKTLYQGSDAMPYPLFHLSLRLIEEIGRLACLSEELGNQVRMLLELK